MALAGPTNASLAAETFRWRTPIPVTDDELVECTVPVHIWGDHDKVQPAEAGIRAAELLPNARVDILAGGHGIWFDERSRCGRLLTEFLRAT